MAKDAVALLLIGGLGTRYGTVPPKQFQVYEGKPLFLRAAETLLGSVSKIVYVCHKDYLDICENELKEASLLRETDSIVVGGSSRQESVKNGLLFLEGKIDDDTIIVINDGNRPNITKKMIEETILQAKEKGAAVVAYRSTDSILMSKDGYLAEGYADRNEVYVVQTPQAFRFEIILKAAKKASKNYTDDGSMVLRELKIKPSIVEGDPKNIKVTTK